MKRDNFLPRVLAIALCVAATASVAGAETAAKGKATATKPAATKPAAVKPVIEAKAVDILKAMSAKLASARSLRFTAVATYESPSRYGAPLAYTTTSSVSLKRPNKLAVVTTADGPATEFYYDGKVMMSYAPAEDLVAIADAPATTEAMLKTLYDSAGTYFPFTDVLVADPYADMAKGMTLAFYIGQSSVVGDVVTDMVAYETDGVFVQMWIGAEDKLPRMARAIYFDDASRLRHQVEMKDWKLNKADDDDFVSKKAAKATPIKFAHPNTRQAPVPAPAAAKPAAKAK